MAATAGTAPITGSSVSEACAASTTGSSVSEACAAAKRAARRLARAGTAVKNAALAGIAAALKEHAPQLLEANAADLARAREQGLAPAYLDKLTLSPERLEAISAGLRTLIALPDPVGEAIDGFRLPNGLDVRRVRVPLGVVAVVYEARPNVTIDAAGLCLKSGNAVVLRGSSAARRSNSLLAELAAAAVAEAGLPAASITMLAGGDREQIAELATQSDSVDLIVPRGGEGLKAALKEVATVPVIYAASGNCHVYVERSADLRAALQIVLNAKVQRPGVCNAAETLLVDAAVAERFLPEALEALHKAGVVLHGDERTRAVSPDGVPVTPASEEDWDTEYLALELAVAVVDGTEQAIEHINAHGSGHSEAILTGDTAAARAFQLGVDAACVYVNASTRFTDGGEFGMGAELANSTQRLHARGPIGLRELCTYKYLIDGDGQVRS
jgi:glutamate-5-semialdehyde dehydrogenase